MMPVLPATTWRLRAALRLASLAFLFTPAVGAAGGSAGGGLGVRTSGQYIWLLALGCGTSG